MTTKTREVIARKLVIVGDGACGKTSLLSVFTLGYFPTDYIPTIFENRVADLKIDGKPVQLALWDTAGQEEYERLRPLSYSKAHVILIAFSISSPDSYENVAAKWIEEVASLCPNVPIILVGLKKDLRDDEEAIAEMKSKGISFVDTKQGETMSQQIGAEKYIECSSLTGENVDDVFEAASRAALLTRERNKDGCCVVL
ncbi:14504_t:CDS:2 [Acaulospora colombiana]|uniref:14504_t:CDS:1 n=1 Tax=Acaulospora colombiana TaxID=27376 RepID=A0ACA9M1I6_9GLOM|nr:14504_t:CDS:2 [Acaulospora colombiana]